MIKVSHFSGQSEVGPTVVPLFGSDESLVKTASASLMSEVSRYISNLKPSPGCQYVLVNAMGAGEYFGSNINGDHFPEAALVHRPDDWTGNPIIDKVRSRTWTYGYPTFYHAHAYAHHRNKDPSRAYGTVELASWNPNMKRVELVVCVDKLRCQQFGGMAVWDKLSAGNYPDVSMGSKVPYDTCSICLDWDLYHKALETYDPKKHRHPGAAVLEFHKKLREKNGIGIRGLSVTRADYCEHAKRMMNRIFPDGRKAFVYNDFPRFFDISFVFIGADKTAKVMLFIYRNGQIYSSKPSADVAAAMNVKEPTGDLEKSASVEDYLLKRAFGKLAKQKRGEIDKRVVPSQFAGKAVPILTNREPDLPRDVMRLLSKLPLEKGLATTGSMGIILKPREFQRITLIQLGKSDLADELDEKNELFPRMDEKESVDLNTSDFMPSLARMLLPLMMMRSALGPAIEKRVVISDGKDEEESKEAASSHNSELLRKIGSAYNGYRSAVMDLVAHSPTLLGSPGTPEDMSKLASAPVDELFTPLTVAYLQQAYLDELPFGDTAGGVVKTSEQAEGRRVEGYPLSEHVRT